MSDGLRGRARILEKWKRRHAKLQKEFEAASFEDQGELIKRRR